MTKIPTELTKLLQHNFDRVLWLAVTCPVLHRRRLSQR